MSVFLSIPEERIIHRGKHFFLIRDIYPVSPGHTLIISNDLKTDYFELSNNQLEELTQMIQKAKELIEKEFNPDGYNIGMNCGEAAGQTVFHFHCHVIPRYIGDMEDPRGGVRGVVPEKQKY
ncbi:MAG: HIT family protein [Bacteroidetes bacterium]|nr:MAG: HIT family protein [Bacteroidota bacterium]